MHSTRVVELSEYQREEVIDRLLRESKTIAVVGASTKMTRPSYEVARYLKEQGYTILPVHPKYGEVLGERCYASLRDVPEIINVVDIFRRPEEVEAHVREAIEVGAGAVWFQEGVVNLQAAELAVSHGLEVVMDRCMLKEHARLMRDN